MYTVRRTPALALATFLMAVVCTTGFESRAASGHDKNKKKTAYGAIAWHQETSRFGYSYDFQTERAANVAALRECGHDRCEIAVSIKNGCAALAQGAKGHAAKKGNTREEAETLALRACGKDCRSVAWACTR